MELTKEHFDKQFDELHNRFDSMSLRIDGIESKMVTKDDSKVFTTKDDLKNFATKDDLVAQTRELQNYTDEVGQIIISAVDNGFNKVHARLQKVELKY